MLLQLPILFALFWALRLTFEMRHSPFIWWIRDLSVPDTIGQFPRGIPLLGGANINILPILMTVAMFLQQKTMPKSDDPQAQQQQKIMSFLPIIFMFLFYTFPSGLCLYWFTSTLLGMGEQLYIRRHLESLPDTPVPANTSTPAKKTSSSGKGKRRR